MGAISNTKYFDGTGFASNFAKLWVGNYPPALLVPPTLNGFLNTPLGEIRLIPLKIVIITIPNLNEKLSASNVLKSEKQKQI